MNDSAPTVVSLAIDKASDRKPRPPFMAVYGPEGIGKSTFAARFPNPLILDLEDGLTGIATDRVRITTYEFAGGSIAIHPCRSAWIQDIGH